MTGTLLAISERTVFAPRGLADGIHFCKKRPVSGSAVSSRSGIACYVFTDIYIEALLVDEELAD